LLFVAALVITPCDRAQAAKPKAAQWKFSSIEPPVSLFLEVQKWWIKELEKRSGGRVNIKIYTLNELNAPKEMIDTVKSGLADVVTAAAAYVPGKTPLGTLQYMPLVAPRRIDQSNHVWSEVSKHPLFVKELSKWNAVFGFCLSLNACNIMSRKPIRTVDDFKGLRIRAVGDQAALFKRLGAIPVSVTAPEIYTALERGLFDAVPGPGEWWFSNWKVSDACKGGYYVEGLDINTSGLHVLINKNSYNKLPQEIKQVIEDLKWEVASVVHEYHAATGVTEYFKDKFRTGGMKIIKFPEAEREKMAAHGPAVWDSWKERYKHAGSYEFFEGFMQAKKKILNQYPEGIYKERPLPPEVKNILEKL
jgi:TRAP-type C4-dicarboxylate transport system substrate-binding protein